MRITFDDAEARALRADARDAAADDAALAYALLDLAEHGVDLDHVVTWDAVLEERGLTSAGETEQGVA
jgi:hypothetical protein